MSKIVEIKSVDHIDGKQYYKEIAPAFFPILPRIGETLIIYHEGKRYKGKICDIIHNVTFPLSIEIVTTILIDNIEEYGFK